QSTRPSSTKGRRDSAEDHFDAFMARRSSEFNLRRPVRTFTRSEFGHGLVAAEESIGPKDAGECPQFRVVTSYGFDVIASRDRNAILRALELRLECKEVLVGLEVGIVFADCNKPTQRAGQLVLRILKLLHFLRIGKL